MDASNKTKDELTTEVLKLNGRIAELEQVVASHKKAAAEICENELRYHRLFETAKDSIILLSMDTGRIIDVNQAFLALSGLTSDELQGKKFQEIKALKHTDVGQVIFKELQNQESLYYDDLPFETRDGRRISVEMICSAHALGSGKIVQCTVRDITRRKSLEEELWRTETRFRTLFREAAIGIAIIDAKGLIVENNRKFEEMLGYGEKDTVGRHFSEFTYPEDRAPDAALYKELLERKRDSYQITVRWVRKDGGIVWGLLAVSLIRERGGLPLYAIRMTEDITDRKRAEEALMKSRNFYLSLIDELPNPIRLADVAGKIHYFNKAWLDFTGRKMDQETDDGWTQGVFPEDLERLMRRYSGSLAARSPYVTEYRLRTRSGEYRWLAEVGRPFHDIDGNFAGYISSCYDVHDRKTFEETLHSVSITDDLTGLLNRRGFFTLAQQQLKVANRNKKGLLLVYADLDGLKKINDTLGHPEGDQALAETASLLHEVFRESDIIGRLGGDEFAVLLMENTGLQDESLILDRLREGVGTRNQLPDRRYALSLSVGIKRYDPETPCSLDEIISQADALMYKEKKSKPPSQKPS